MHTNHSTHGDSVSRTGLVRARGRTTIVALAAVTLGIAATACGSGTEVGDPTIDESVTTTETPSASTDTPTTTPAQAPTPDTVTTEPEPVASAVAFDIVLRLDSTPAVGDFVVSSGSEALGCDDGRFYLSTDDYNLSHMTCESGSKTGEFQMLIDPTLGDDETFTGTWTILSGSGDFETLSGGGELEDVRDVPGGSIIGTRIGEIQYADTDG